jgi:Rps23 Pro-64 3,4-dihydroxylase Tpa1-like proline 4-hydroxylase
VLKIYNDILDSKTQKELQKICEDFDNRDFKNVNYENDNYYVRLFIKQDILVDYLNNAKKYLIQNLPYEDTKIIDFDDSVSWINKVSTETNKNDAVHYDTSILTLVTYLNDEFEGGDFIYINKNKEKKSIIPKKNMTVIMNDKLLHKVSSVSGGVRFSLVTFFKFKGKKNKTLI